MGTIGWLLPHGSASARKPGGKPRMPTGRAPKRHGRANTGTPCGVGGWTGFATTSASLEVLASGNGSLSDPADDETTLVGLTSASSDDAAPERESDSRSDMLPAVLPDSERQRWFERKRAAEPACFTL